MPCRTRVHDPAPSGHCKQGHSHEAAEEERARAAQEAQLSRLGYNTPATGEFRRHRTSLPLCWLSALL